MMRRFSLSASSPPSCRVSSSMRARNCPARSASSRSRVSMLSQDGFDPWVLAHAVLQEAMVAPVRRRLMTEVIARGGYHLT